jgi:hypothetical protein
MSLRFPEQNRSRPLVVASFEDADGFRCVDILELPGKTFGFKEFRRDPEDSGRWTLIGDYSHLSFAAKRDALRAAAAHLPWFAAMQIARPD